MGRNIKTLFIAVTIVFFNFQFPKAFANTLCQPIYGGGETCAASSKISIDKKVLNPKTGLLVDNLGINDSKYQPGFILTFQIKITNTGNDMLSKVDIKDIFPKYMLFTGADESFDPNTKTLSLSTADLSSNETRTFNIFGRIAANDQLPQGVVCVINQAIATTDNSQISRDNAQFCIENTVKATAPSGFPIFPTSNLKQTPATGPESLALFSLIPTGIAGWFLRRKFKQGFSL